MSARRKSSPPCPQPSLPDVTYTHSQDGETSLQAEIAMLRSAIRRVFSLTDSLHGQADLTGSPIGVSDYIRILDSLGKASTRLANLLKSQAALQGGQRDALMDSITHVLQQVTEELRLK